MPFESVVFNDHTMFLLQLFHKCLFTCAFHHCSGRNQRPPFKTDPQPTAYAVESPVHGVREASEGSLYCLLTQSPAEMSREGGRRTARAIGTRQRILDPGRASAAGRHICLYSRWEPVLSPGFPLLSRLWLHGLPWGTRHSNPSLPGGFHRPRVRSDPSRVAWAGHRHYIRVNVASCVEQPWPDTEHRFLSDLITQRASPSLLSPARGLPACDPRGCGGALGPRSCLVAVPAWGPEAAGRPERVPGKPRAHEAGP